jgi:cytochrome c oxidase subunit 4
MSEHGHPEAPGEHHHGGHDVSKDIPKYIGVFAALLVLTLVTVGASYIHIGPPGDHSGNIILGLVIASIKAALVAWIFMHLAWEKGLIFRILIFTAIFVLGLFLLLVATHNDPIKF